MSSLALSNGLDGVGSRPQRAARHLRLRDASLLAKFWCEVGQSEFSQ